MDNEEGNTSTVGKESLAYIQLEKQNERLKEALLRLRDMTQETDLDQRRKISELEKDIGSVDELQCRHPFLYLTFAHAFQAQYDSSVIKLANAEIQIEDLKLQLDDALGAEEMLVQLTERNLMLGEVSMFLQTHTFLNLRARKSKKCALRSRIWRHSRN